MNVYIIEANDCDYDEFDSCVVVAESKEKALKIAVKGEEGFYFVETQYPLTAEKIDLNEKAIVHASFKAG